MSIETPDDLKRVVSELGTSIWAHAALMAALELDLLEPLLEPLELGELARRSKQPPELVLRLLEVLVALGVVRADGNRFVVAAGLVPFAKLPERRWLLGELNTDALQAAAFVDQIGRGAFVGGWIHTSLPLLEAQGEHSASLARLLVARIAPTLDGLSARLAAPNAAVLDVGTGVGAWAIEMCRLLPQLRLVGLEPWEISRTRAQQNVEAAAMRERIEIRAHGVEELDDRGVYDFAWLPAQYIPEKSVAQGIECTFRALRPGGWTLVAALMTPGESLQSAVGRLKLLTWGGPRHEVAVMESMMTSAGYASIRKVPLPAGAAVLLGQKPG